MSEAAARQHRLDLVTLTNLAEDELRAIWVAAFTSDAAAFRDVLMEAVPAIGDTYGDMAGALAADYYEEIRELSEVPGRYFAEPAPLPGTARYEALVRWGVDPLFSEAPDPELARSLISGGLQRSVAQVARDTVTQSAVRDPQAQGWKRVTRSGGCRFCRMLADRGAVYKDETVRFASHDNCHCSASPAWDSSRSATVNQYRASKRRQTPADRERVREYLNANY